MYTDTQALTALLNNWWDLSTPSDYVLEASLSDCALEQIWVFCLFVVLSGPVFLP